ncbi:MAG: hypothetical protein JWM60_1896 [Solirubrobacterales bacterium]|nr:hypothetical protein [Solirubrobacterales bacterium]
MTPDEAQKIVATFTGSMRRLGESFARAADAIDLFDVKLNGPYSPGWYSRFARRLHAANDARLGVQR